MKEKIEAFVLSRKGKIIIGSILILVIGIVVGVNVAQANKENQEAKTELKKHIAIIEKDTDNSFIEDIKQVRIVSLADTGNKLLKEGNTQKMKKHSAAIKKEIPEIEKAKEEGRNDKILELGARIELFQYTSLKLAGEAETVGNKFIDVWNDAIYNDSVKVGTKSYTDFNDALAAQYKNFEVNGEIESIESKEENVETMFYGIKEKVELLNSHESEFEAMKPYYIKLQEFVSVATEPDGSLRTYREKYNDAKSEFMTAYKEFEIEIQ